MSKKTLGLIHTSATLVPIFDKLCNEHLDGIDRFNIVDDSLISICIEEGELTPPTARRVVEYVGSAEDAGADYILVTCSSIGTATLPTTLNPTSDLVERRAAKAGKEIELTSRLCEGAFDALMGGNPETHDQMVAEALKELSDKVDVILLAQASMARVVDQLDESEKSVPILASPPNAVEYLASVL